MESTKAESDEPQPEPLSPAAWWYGNRQVWRDAYSEIEKRYRSHFRNREESDAATHDAIIRILQARTGVFENAPSTVDKSTPEGKASFNRQLIKAFCAFSTSKNSMLFRSVVSKTISDRTGVKNVKSTRGNIVYGSSTTSAPGREEEDNQADIPAIISDAENRFAPLDAAQTNSAANNTNTPGKRQIVVQFIYDDSGVAGNNTHLASERNTPESILIEKQHREYLWKKVSALMDDIDDCDERCRFMHFLETLSKNINNPSVAEELLRGTTSQIRKDILLPILRSAWKEDDWSDANYNKARDRLRKLKAPSQPKATPSVISESEFSFRSAGSCDPIRTRRISIARTEQ